MRLKFIQHAIIGQLWHCLAIQLLPVCTLTPISHDALKLDLTQCLCTSWRDLSDTLHEVLERFSRS